MGNYLANSSNIFVFPTTKREQVSRSSRLLTEKNIVDIVNKLIDVESFVITRDYVYGINSSMDFNINGYYINVDDFDEVIDSVVDGETLVAGSCIWANILIYKTGDYDELYGTDENNTYNGVIFTFNNPIPDQGSGVSVKKLKLIEFLSSSVNSAIIPQNSLVKFTADRINPIDCGEIV